MGYRTPNEESHICLYCDRIVAAGQGVLLKYSPAQSDTAILTSRFTNRIGHERCTELYGSRYEQEALFPS